MLKPFLFKLLSRNTSLAPIVYFVKEDSEQRASALKILSNFCKDPCAFYMLSTADSIVAACELLMAVNMAKPLSESECRHCVNIISTLSADACSRSKIRRCGALRKLVAMIRESHSQSERSSVSWCLTHFKQTIKSSIFFFLSYFTFWTTFNMTIWVWSCCCMRAWCRCWCVN